MIKWKNDGTIITTITKGKTPVFQVEEAESPDDVILKIRIPTRTFKAFDQYTYEQKTNIYDLILETLKKSANRYKNMTFFQQPDE